jgi:hypothetical protein
MQWEERKALYGSDYYSPGFAIVRQVSGRFALYRTFPDSDCADGRCLGVGTLDECKSYAAIIAKLDKG